MRDAKETARSLHNAVMHLGNSLIVVGAQWGDEGKGKAIDLLADLFDVVVRFGGGAGAGHTIYTHDGEKIACQLIPCGIARGKACVIGRGVLFDLARFVEELNQLPMEARANSTKIRIDHLCPLWTPYHALLEKYLEWMRGEDKINTTGRAIGPLAGLDRLHMSIYVGELFADRVNFIKKLKYLYNTIAPCCFRAGYSMPDPDKAADELLELAPQIANMVTDTAELLYHYRIEKVTMAYEGAQATGLDPRWGTPPYTSSGDSVAQGAPVGTGLPLSSFDGTMMVFKALPTRVGAGPFPSELWGRSEAEQFALNNRNLFESGKERLEFLRSLLNDINNGAADKTMMSRYFQVLGDERGTVSGRGRSVGFLDLHWLRYAMRVNAPDYLALMKLDMFSGLLEIPVVAGYKLRGRNLRPSEMPPPWLLPEVEPVYVNRRGWQEDISDCDTWEALPAQTQDFVTWLEEELQKPIVMIGTGPGRDAMIIREL